MSDDSEVNTILSLIDQCSEAERSAILKYLRQRHNLTLHPLEKEWGITAETILTAIARSSDLTRRGIRGIIAEATFEEFVLPTVSPWKAVSLGGDQSYDFLLELAAQGTGRKIQASVQVKLQRMEKKAPKTASARLRERLDFAGEQLYVVEVQKTRSGLENGEATRPYKFGDFDILAVNMHPSTGDWKRFLYTVGSWLLPRPEHTSLIQIMQPVPSRPDDCWTDDLRLCLQWFRSGIKKHLYGV